MIAFIQGEVFEVQEDCFIILVNGIGYQVYAPIAAFQPLPKIGDEIALYTYLHIREDICLLFGFRNKKELALFNMLLSVNGIGAKTALAMLNTLSYREIVKALQFGNSLLLTKIPGIGKKTAERVILELSDKIKKLEPLPLDTGDDSVETPVKQVNDININIKNMAIAALSQLGYSNTLAIKYVETAIEELPENSSLEIIITMALKEAAAK